jgi:hypothetical protein
MNMEKKRKYEKPAIIHRDKVEVLAAVCTSAWNGSLTCRLQGQAGCQKTKF